MFFAPLNTPLAFSTLFPWVVKTLFTLFLVLKRITVNHKIKWYAINKYKREFHSTVALVKVLSANHQHWNGFTLKHINLPFPPRSNYFIPLSRRIEFLEIPKIKKWITPSLKFCYTYPPCKKQYMRSAFKCQIFISHLKCECCPWRYFDPILFCQVR